MVKRALGILLVVMLIGVFSGLGSWQLQRADYKRALADRIAATRVLPPLRIEHALSDADKLEYRKVELSGRFEPLLIYWDNQLHRGRPGYYVVAPLRLAGREQRILVNRGWIAAGRDRTILPKVDVPAGPVTLVGEVRVPRKAYLPGVDRPGAAVGGVWLYVDPAYVGTTQGYPVAGRMVWQTDAAIDDGLVRDWPAIEVDESMHIGYAVQWFAFAAILAGFLGWQAVRQLRK